MKGSSVIVVCKKTSKGPNAFQSQAVNEVCELMAQILILDDESVPWWWAKASSYTFRYY